MTANPHSYGHPLAAALGDGREAPAAERDPPYLQGLNKEQREAVLAAKATAVVSGEHFGAGCARSERVGRLWEPADERTHLSN